MTGFHDTILACITLSLQTHNNIRQLTDGGAPCEPHTQNIKVMRSEPNAGGPDRDIAQRQSQVEDLEARYLEIKVLQEISQTVMESADLQAMVSRILEQTMASGDFHAGLIQLADPKTGLMAPAASHGEHEPEATYDIIVPVTANGETLGELLLGSRDPGRTCPSQLRFLETIGAQIGLGVQKAKLNEDRARLAAILEATTDSVSIADAAGQVQYLNRAARELFGLDPDAEIRSLDLGDRCPEWARQLLKREAIPTALQDGLWSGELAYRDTDGREIPVSQLIIAHAGARGMPGYISTIARDISEDKQAEAALKHQALHDALTGLPNRTLLRDRIQHALAEARREDQLLALLVMDLDRFKDVNDTFGHPWGDLLLQQVTARMLGVVRECDTVARLGGDEFAIVLQGVTNEEDAVSVAARILAACEQPFLVEGQELSVGVSIGIAMFPRHADDPDVLLRFADVAMYVAKREDRGIALYNSEQDQHNPSRAALLSDLRHAVDGSELELYFQPKASISSGRLIGVEALVRWRHPERGLLLPADFLSLAEQTGLMGSIGQWVLRRAVEQCQMWTQQGLDLPVAVNLAAQNLRDLRLPQVVALLLEETGVPPSRLQIEITEGAIMSDQPDILDVLSELHDMGVRISIDDFGTGYSSLVHLRRLPVDEIKIDRSFVSGMVNDENATAIVRSTIDLGHNLGLEVVAEGVEDVQTWTLLDDLGCDIVQGYALNRPMPARELVSWAKKWTKTARKRFMKAGRGAQAKDNFWDVA